MNLAVPIVMPAPIANEAGPHCIEAEQALIGTLLSYEAARNDVLPILKPDHFHEHLLARMYAWIAECAQTGARCDAITCIARFKNDATLIELGGNHYIARLAAIADTPMMAKCYADTIIQYWKRRILMEIGEAVASGAAEPGMSVEQLYAAAIEELSRPDETAQSTLIQPGAIAATILDRAMSGEQPQRGAYAGSDQLDRLIAGWQRGNLYVIAGRPGMGKSTFAPSLLLQTARRGHRVLYVSLEMTAQQLTQRALSDLAYTRDGSLSYTDIRDGRLTDWQKQRLTQVAPFLAGLPITYTDKAGLTVADVMLLVQREERERGKVDVVCIDHIGLLRPARELGNKVAETEGISNSLKVMAKNMNLAVIALSQLSRANEQRGTQPDDKRPTLADLRWSGAIEQDADVVLLLYREAYYLERMKGRDGDREAVRVARLKEVRNKLEAIVAKNRDGQTPVLVFEADMGACHVRDEE
jgi:replicative DNA helicase